MELKAGRVNTLILQFIEALIKMNSSQKMRLSFMEWTSEEIKHLRLRLGWSRSDLARRMSIDCKLISLWEQGERLPDFQETEMLDMIAKQADISADEVSSAPIAEIFCDESDVDQCDLSSVRTSKHPKN